MLAVGTDESLWLVGMHKQIAIREISLRGKSRDQLMIYVTFSFIGLNTSSRRWTSKITAGQQDRRYIIHKLSYSRQ